MNLTHADESLIESYLANLKRELSDQDPALIQDALFDAKQHFYDAMSEQEGVSASQVIDDYGDVTSIAMFYRDVEEKVRFSYGGKKAKGGDSVAPGLFILAKDPDAYRALLFGLLSFPLGIAYFAWTIMVGIVSLVSSLLVVGIPLMVFYLKSMQYFSLFEGKIIESLLGERMPRRPAYVPAMGTGSPLSHVWGLLKKRENWTSAAYLAIKLPISCVNLALFVLPALLSVGLILTPVVDPILHYFDPAVTVDIHWYWFAITLPIGGGLFLCSLLLAKKLGDIQAKFAKFMLVSF